MIQFPAGALLFWWTRDTFFSGGFSVEFLMDDWHVSSREGTLLYLGSWGCSVERCDAVLSRFRSGGLLVVIRRSTWTHRRLLRS